MIEFNIQEINVSTETMKKKNWTALGTDRIKNYCLKRFIPVQNALKRSFNKLGKIKIKNEFTPPWWRAGWTVIVLYDKRYQ